MPQEIYRNTYLILVQLCVNPPRIFSINSRLANCILENYGHSTCNLHRAVVNESILESITKPVLADKFRMYRRTGYRFWWPDVRLQRKYNSVSSVAILPFYTVFNKLKSDLWCRIPGTHDLYIKIIYSLRKARETIRLSRTVFRMSKLLNSVYNRIYISASFLHILKN